jgi:hypothetical protein
MLLAENIKEGETYFIESRGQITRAQCLNVAGDHSIEFVILMKSGETCEIHVNSRQVFESDFLAYLHCKDQVKRWQEQADKMEAVVCAGAGE